MAHDSDRPAERLTPANDRPQLFNPVTRAWEDVTPAERARIARLVAGGVAQQDADADAPRRSRGHGAELVAADVTSKQIIDFPNVWHGTCDETAWPVDLIGDMSWVLRYGDPATIIERRMTVASFVSSYNYLVDPNLSQTDAIAALKRARKVAAHAHGPKEKL